ncbi:hypothetical protein MGN70_003028 [Eutypa lata]|nr:hypothetical protein MGN70_003028 [Eutypa lata]
MFPPFSQRHLEQAHAAFDRRWVLTMMKKEVPAWEASDAQSFEQAMIRTASNIPTRPASTNGTQQAHPSSSTITASIINISSPTTTMRSTTTTASSEIAITEGLDIPLISDPPRSAIHLVQTRVLALDSWLRLAHFPEDVVSRLSDAAKQAIAVFLGYGVDWRQHEDTFHDIFYLCQSRYEKIVADEMTGLGSDKGKWEYVEAVMNQKFPAAPDTTNGESPRLGEP